jgi:hypothetical protein
VQRAINILDIKITSVNAGIVGERVSLNSDYGTGMTFILSSEGAERTAQKAKVRSINFIMIRNLLFVIINIRVCLFPCIDPTFIIINHVLEMVR